MSSKLYFCLSLILLLGVPASMQAQSASKIVGIIGKKLPKLKNVKPPKTIKKINLSGVSKKKLPKGQGQNKPNTYIDIKNSGNLTVDNSTYTTNNFNLPEIATTPPQKDMVVSNMPEIPYNEIPAANTSRQMVDHRFDVQAGFFRNDVIGPYGTLISTYTFAAQNNVSRTVRFYFYGVNHYLRQQVAYEVVLEPGQVFTFGVNMNWYWQPGEIAYIVYDNGQTVFWPF